MRRFLASEDGANFGELGPDAQLLYIVGILICDDGGIISKATLDKAVSDHQLRYAAIVVAGRVGVLGGPAPSLDRYA